MTMGCRNEERGCRGTSLIRHAHPQPSTLSPHVLQWKGFAVIAVVAGAIGGFLNIRHYQRQQPPAVSTRLTCLDKTGLSYRGISLIRNSPPP